VRPLLEYSSQVWSPHLLCNIDRIESAQRHFTKSFPGLKDLPYPERLRALNLQSLEVRRLRADYVFLQKMRLGYADTPFALLTLQSSISSRRDLYVRATTTFIYQLRLYPGEKKFMNWWTVMNSSWSFMNVHVNSSCQIYQNSWSFCVHELGKKFMKIF